MNTRAPSGAGLLVALACLSACEVVLGFEDHELGDPFGASAGGVAGSGVAGESGSSTAGTTTAAGMGGVSGNAGEAGMPGSELAGNGGSAGDSSSAGAGGSGGSCLLCEAGDALVHRYTFDGTGTTVEDTVGTADGTVINAAGLAGDGTLTLAGETSDEYVDLPNGIISSLTDATFEAWVSWDGGGDWQRIFDFGSSTGAEGEQDQSQTSVFVSPQGVGMGPIRASFTLNGQAGEKFVTGTTTLPTTVTSQVVLVVEGNTMKLYRDGASEGLTSPIGPLSSLNDVNNWLGRSQWIGDDEFGGTYYDFRIYGAALSDAAISALLEAGPDVAF